MNIIEYKKGFWLIYGRTSSYVCGRATQEFSKKKKFQKKIFKKKKKFKNISRYSHKYTTVFDHRHDGRCWVNMIDYENKSDERRCVIIDDHRSWFFSKKK